MGREGSRSAGKCDLRAHSLNLPALLPGRSGGVHGAGAGRGAREVHTRLLGQKIKIFEKSQKCREWLEMGREGSGGGQK